MTKCKYCGIERAMDTTKLCDSCWEAKRHVECCSPHLLNTIIEDIRPKEFITVGVKYATSLMIYTFMTDEDCEVGDKAVVFTNGHWNVVTIIEIHDKPHLDDGYSYTWLVQIVDRTNYDRHIALDGEGYPKVGDRL